MRSNKEIRLIARQELKGFWTMPVLAMLVYTLVSSACSAPNVLSNVGPVSFRVFFGMLTFAIEILVLIPLQYGFYLAYLHFLREDKEDTVEQIFCGFKTYDRSIAVTILYTIFIFLWSLLLVIPGLIKALSYSMTFYISKDHPELSANECIDRSIDMMKGHKAQLFWLFMGYLGMVILSVFTLFIGLLWVQPYYQVCKAAFYENLKAEEAARMAEEEKLLSICADEETETAEMTESVETPEVEDSNMDKTEDANDL